MILPTWYMNDINPVHGSFFRDQAQALANNGLRVGVVAPTAISLRYAKSWKQVQRGLKRYNDDGVITYQHIFWNIFPKMPTLNIKRYVKIGLHLFEQYVKENDIPDIIHAHAAIQGGVLAREISRRYKIPYVITEHSSDFARNTYSSLEIRIADQVFENANARIVVSPTFGKLIEEKFPRSFQAWEYVPNIVGSDFKPGNNDKSTRDNAEFTFLHIASLNAEKKGQKELLQAFCHAFKDNPNVRLRIGGDGPSRKELEQLSEQLGIRKQVAFLGLLKREKVVKEMQNCETLVLASPFETFGVVLIEALSCGKPVIATACGGPEHIVNEENGYLVPPNNVRALATAMQKMKERIQKFDSEKIAIDCQQKYGTVAIAERLKKVYFNILEGQKQHNMIAHKDGI